MTTDAVPSRPLREWLTAWMIITGDPPETIAKGFDLDVTFVADLLGAEPPRMLDVVLARELCIKLRLDPAELWQRPHEVLSRSWATEPWELDVPWLGAR